MIRPLALLAAALLVVAPARAEVRPIDPRHSEATFAVRLFWFRTIDGRFGQVTGHTATTPDGRLVVEARVAVDHLEMASARLRRWTLAPAFFDAARYPMIRFVSDPLAPSRLVRGGALTGRLTLRGVTRPARFELAPTACAASAPLDCPMHASGSIRRGDFGMLAHRHALADEVKLDLVISVLHTPD